MSNEQPLEDKPKRLSIAILGCGKLGTSLLQGLLSYQQSSSTFSKSSLPLPAVHNPLEISHIKVTVRECVNVGRIQRVVQPLQAKSSEMRLSTPHVSVGLQDQNGPAAQEADIVILGCKPHAFKDVLRDQEVRKALIQGKKGKTLVSILGGVTISQLASCLYKFDLETTGTEHLPNMVNSKPRCTIIRAIPNIAARIHESMTILSSSSSSTQLSDEDSVVSHLFSLLGPVKRLPEAQINYASTLAASSLAFHANIISAAADGALGSGNGEGLSREDAVWISAQAARGASGLVVVGEDPWHIVGEVATKGGSTAAGLDVMERRGVGAAVAEAVQECTRATAQLSNANE